VLDVENGYFDRLLLTAVRRLAILLGHLLADVTVAFTLTVPIVILAFGPGVPGALCQFASAVVVLVPPPARQRSRSKAISAP
jgi:hypothetical protein